MEKTTDLKWPSSKWAKYKKEKNQEENENINKAETEEELAIDILFPVGWDDVDDLKEDDTLHPGWEDDDDDIEEKKELYEISPIDFLFPDGWDDKEYELELQRNALDWIKDENKSSNIFPLSTGWYPHDFWYQLKKWLIKKNIQKVKDFYDLSLKQLYSFIIVYKGRKCYNKLSKLFDILYNDLCYYSKRNKWKNHFVFDVNVKRKQLKFYQCGNYREQQKEKDVLDEDMLILIDWDNTLWPTTDIHNRVTDNIQMMKLIGKNILKLLKRIIIKWRKINIKIVTNGSCNWVWNKCLRRAAETLPIYQEIIHYIKDEGIQIISARDKWENKYNANNELFTPMQWKQNVFSEMFEKNTYSSNILSIGDSNRDHIAITRALENDSYHELIGRKHHKIKFKIKPCIHELNKQLMYINYVIKSVEFGKIGSFEKPIDINFKSLKCHKADGCNKYIRT